MKSLLIRPTLKNVVLPILIDLKHLSDGGYILTGTASSIDGDASGRHGVSGHGKRQKKEKNKFKRRKPLTHLNRVGSNF